MSLKAHKMIALLKSCCEKIKPALIVQKDLLRESISVSISCCAARGDGVENSKRCRDTW